MTSPGCEHTKVSLYEVACWRRINFNRYVRYIRTDRRNQWFPVRFSHGWPRQYNIIIGSLVYNWRSARLGTPVPISSQRASHSAGPFALPTGLLQHDYARSDSVRRPGAPSSTPGVDRQDQHRYGTSPGYLPPPEGGSYTWCPAISAGYAPTSCAPAHAIARLLPRTDRAEGPAGGEPDAAVGPVLPEPAPRSGRRRRRGRLRERIGSGLSEAISVGYFVLPADGVRRIANNPTKTFVNLPHSYANH